MNWEEIKKSDKAFPKDKIVITEVEFKEGIRTAWINVGYKNYPYKEFCKTLGILTVDFEDMNTIHEQEIQLYFQKELNKGFVSHLISRIPTEFGIEMLFYFENNELAIKKLNEIYEDKDKLVDFGCQTQEDSEWKTIDGMMKRFSK